LLGRAPAKFIIRRVVGDMREKAGISRERYVDTTSIYRGGESDLSQCNAEGRVLQRLEGIRWGMKARPASRYPRTQAREVQEQLGGFSREEGGVPTLWIIGTLGARWGIMRMRKWRGK